MRPLLALLATCGLAAAQSTPPCTTVTELLYVPSPTGNVLMPTGSSVQLGLGYTTPIGGTLLGPGSVRTVITNGVWSPRQAYTLGLQVLDSNGNTQRVTTPGTSALKAPVWQSGASATTQDGSVVWTNQGVVGGTKSITVCLSAGNWTALWTVLQAVAGQPLAPVTYTRYWTVPASGPVTVTSIQATTPTTPNLSIAPGQIIPSQTNGYFLGTAAGISTWLPISAFIPSSPQQVIANTGSGPAGATNLTLTSSALGVNRTTPFSALAMVVEATFSTGGGQPLWFPGDAVSFSGGGSGVVGASRASNLDGVATVILSSFTGSISGTFSSTQSSAPTLTVVSAIVYTVSGGADINGSLNGSNLYLNSSLFAYGFDNPGTRGRGTYLGNGAGNQNTSVGTIGANGSTGTANALSTGVGSMSLHSQTTGFVNAALGANALYACTTCYDSVAVGSDSLENVQAGFELIGLGHLAGAALNSTGQQEDICIGSSSCRGASTGFSYNILLGHETASATGITTGAGNVVIGNNVTGLASAATNTLTLADGVGNIKMAFDSTGIPTVPQFTTPGFVQSTSGGILSSAALTGTQVNVALGYTPLSAAIPGSTGQFLYNNSGGLATTSGITTPDGNNLVTTSLTVGASGAGVLLTNTGASLILQTGVPNTFTQVRVFPSGTGSTSTFGLFNGSDTTSTNNTRFAIQFTNSGVTANLNLTTFGSGTTVTGLNIGSASGTSGLTNICLEFAGTCQGTLSSTGNWKVASQQITSLGVGIGHYDASGNLTSSPVVSSDISGPLNANGGTNVIYRCTVAGTLRVGQLTSVAADCGTAVDTGLRTN